MSDDLKFSIALTLAFIVVWVLSTIRQLLSVTFAWQIKEKLYNCIFSPSTDEGILVAISCIMNWVLSIAWLIYFFYCLL